MSVLTEAWFWLLVIGVILIFVGILLWGVKGTPSWWNWTLIALGDISIISAMVVLDRGRIF